MIAPKKHQYLKEVKLIISKGMLNLQRSELLIARNKHQC